VQSREVQHKWSLRYERHRQRNAVLYNEGSTYVQKCWLLRKRNVQNTPMQEKVRMDVRRCTTVLATMLAPRNRGPANLADANPRQTMRDA
jgi:hypothetical protein